MNGGVAVRAHGSLVEPGWTRRAEAEVKLGDDGVTRVAELAHLLVSEHVPIRAAVRLVAGAATFHP